MPGRHMSISTAGRANSPAAARERGSSWVPRVWNMVLHLADGGVNEATRGAGGSIEFAAGAYSALSSWALRRPASRAGPERVPVRRLMAWHTVAKLGVT